LGQLIQYSFFQITKRSFSVALKGLPDGAAQTLFNDVVRIKERKLQPPGELPTDGGFSGAWEADKRNHRALLVAITRAPDSHYKLAAR
jgi:hypothetical protein